jgi:hypothetical protein
LPCLTWPAFLHDPSAGIVWQIGSGDACQTCMGADIRVLRSLIGVRGGAGGGSFRLTLNGRSRFIVGNP